MPGLALAEQRPNPNPAIQFYVGSSTSGTSPVWYTSSVTSAVTSTSTCTGIITFTSPSTASYTSTLYCPGTTLIVSGTSTTVYTTASCGYITYVVPSVETVGDTARREKAERQRHRVRALEVDRARGSIKRALKLIDNVGFGDDVRVFLGGSSVEVSHPDSMFKFLLTKHYSSLINKTIHTRGHTIPYKLELYTKTDVHVADLCVYVQDTPVLDQVLALSMFIKSGDEDYILEKANWTLRDCDEVLSQAILLDNPELSPKFRNWRPRNSNHQSTHSRRT